MRLDLAEGDDARGVDDAVEAGCPLPLLPRSECQDEPRTGQERRLRLISPGGIDDQNVVVVDDVAYTGRTVRAALNELSDWGRPSRIVFCALVDRGGRELPIQPDITGRTVDVGESERIDVCVPALDGRLGVELIRTRAED